VNNPPPLEAKPAPLAQALSGASPGLASGRSVLFLLFFVSGFCGLVYQIVWTRLAFAAFGIITPVLSVVISVFMAGLSLGAWAGGKWIGGLARRTGLSPIGFYAVAEFAIGLGAFAVPKLFAVGKHVLLPAGETDSLTYLLFSAVVLAIAILPWCICMGTTFPFMMAYVRQQEARSADSFSYLYLANVLGAMSGAVLTAVALVEIFGFHDTLHVAAAGNFAVTGISVLLALAARGRAGAMPGETASAPPLAAAPAAVAAGSAWETGRFIQALLFTTGLVAMAMEVVWTRAFAPVLKTQVYSFAAVLTAYLGATFGGSWLYRRHLRRHTLRPTAELVSLLCGFALLPVLANDPRFVRAEFWEGIPNLRSAAILLASIVPFCGLLGYLTPQLVDRYSAGSPQKAGAAYAVNVLGCILGPLFASYLLLTRLSERYALLLLGLPFLGFFLFCCPRLSGRQRWGWGATSGAVLAAALFFTRDFEDSVTRLMGRPPILRRDYAASVLSFGEGANRSLVVNGLGMTKLTPITKLMAHLPLAFHRGQPQSGLVICFGMGTTYRSCLSWDIDTTTVELVPSVVAAFGFYHADAARLMANPKGHIIIDDGRRFLERTRVRFDVIVIDPPPPVEAAGSSLLYSEEFYAAAKQRLNTNGVLQAWVPWHALVGRAALRSLCNQFPYVRCFDSVEGWGVHLLASMEPIEPLSLAELTARMPDAAKRDLCEWTPSVPAEAYLRQVLRHETAAERNLNPNPLLRITDDQPFNEYFLLREFGLF
jgi:spermidine synthase